MQDFAKIFATILTSSVWEESASTRIVWFTLLLLRDLDEVVLATPEALARVCNLPMVHVRQAITLLESPDPHSRSKEEEGRRILQVPGGWRIVNGAYYRNLLNVEDKREKARQRKARFDARHRNAVSNAGNASNAKRGEEKIVEERKGEEMSNAPTPSPDPAPLRSILDAMREASWGGTNEQQETEVRGVIAAGVRVEEAIAWVRDHPGRDVFALRKALVPRDDGSGPGQFDPAKWLEKRRAANGQK